MACASEPDAAEGSLNARPQDHDLHFPPVRVVEALVSVESQFARLEAILSDMASQVRVFQITGDCTKGPFRTVV
jgi:hypothetical protein